MKSFNLFSQDINKKLYSRSLVKIPTLLASLFGIVFFVIFISIILFFINLYIDNQIDTKGKLLIQKINQQQTYSDNINKINTLNNVKGAINSITKDPLKLQDVVRQLNTVSNNTITSMSLDKANQNAEIKGLLNDSSTLPQMYTALSNVQTINNVRILHLQKYNSSYTYDISFNINYEKL